MFTPVFSGLSKGRLEEAAMLRQLIAQMGWFVGLVLLLAGALTGQAPFVLGGVPIFIVGVLAFARTRSRT